MTALAPSLLITEDLIMALIMDTALTTDLTITIIMGAVASVGWWRE